MTNARFSFKNIAERVGLSANAVKARVDGMIHDKIIEIFCQTIIRSHVGLDIEFNILIKLKNITVENKREAIENCLKLNVYCTLWNFKAGGILVYLLYV